MENFIPTLEYYTGVIDLISEHEIEGFWNAGRFCINCSDIFAWGYADAELVTPEDIPDLKKACDEAHAVGAFFDGPMLFCARKHGMRPQGAAYGAISRELWPLLDACGPPRPPGLGNPVGTEGIEDYIAHTTAMREQTRTYPERTKTLLGRVFTWMMKPGADEQNEEKQEILTALEEVLHPKPLKPVE